MCFEASATASARPAFHTLRALVTQRLLPTPDAQSRAVVELVKVTYAVSNTIKKVDCTNCLA